MTTLPNGDAMEPSPTAHDVQRMMRSQNLRFAVGFVVLLLCVGGTAWLAGGGRAAARDNVTATEASLASNGRNACLAERRNVQSEALGDMVRHGLSAQIAGLVLGDDGTAAAEVKATQEATARWQEATLSLRPEQLNAAVADGGCGPPVLSTDDLSRGD